MSGAIGDVLNGEEKKGLKAGAAALGDTVAANSAGGESAVECDKSTALDTSASSPVVGGLAAVLSEDKSKKDGAETTKASADKMMSNEALAASLNAFNKSGGALLQGPSLFPGLIQPGLGLLSEQTAGVVSPSGLANPAGISPPSTGGAESDEKTVSSSTANILGLAVTPEKSPGISGMVGTISSLNATNDLSPASSSPVNILTNVLGESGLGNKPVQGELSAIATNLSSALSPLATPQNDGAARPGFPETVQSTAEAGSAAASLAAISKQLSANLGLVLEPSVPGAEDTSEVATKLPAVPTDFANVLAVVQGAGTLPVQEELTTKPAEMGTNPTSKEIPTKPAIDGTGKEAEAKLEQQAANAAPAFSPSQILSPLSAKTAMEVKQAASAPSATLTTGTAMEVEKKDLTPKTVVPPPPPSKLALPPGSAMATDPQEKPSASSEPVTSPRPAPVSPPPSVSLPPPPPSLLPPPPPSLLPPPPASLLTPPPSPSTNDKVEQQQEEQKAEVKNKDDDVVRAQNVVVESKDHPKQSVVEEQVLEKSEVATDANPPLSEEAKEEVKADSDLMGEPAEEKLDEIENASEEDGLWDIQTLKSKIDQADWVDASAKAWFTPKRMWRLMAVEENAARGNKRGQEKCPDSEKALYYGVTGKRLKMQRLLEKGRVRLPKIEFSQLFKVAGSCNILRDNVIPKLKQLTQEQYAQMRQGDRQQRLAETNMEEKMSVPEEKQSEPQQNEDSGALATDGEAGENNDKMHKMLLQQQQQQQQLVLGQLQTVEDCVSAEKSLIEQMKLVHAKVQEFQMYLQHPLITQEQKIQLAQELDNKRRLLVQCQYYITQVRQQMERLQQN
mmetsp:Transcript_8790/g.14257  ORF Transcript_8790/g.14257 Transcript_8790/m.14257 type:complete len:847 (+) Transcript_8790:347-2887(+)